MTNWQAEKLETVKLDINLSTKGDLIFSPSLSELLNEPVSEVSPWEFAHRLAADNWQNHYQPKSLDFPLETVRGYLEAYHHFCEVADWTKATQILLMPLSAWNNQLLHRQLGRWGYYQEQAELYTQLLQEDLELELQYICLDGLGWATCYMGKFQEAIVHYRHLLTLAQKFQSKEFEARALGGLGNVDEYLGRFRESKKLYQKQLELAQEFRYLAEEGWAACNLGFHYAKQGQHDVGLRYFDQGVMVAKQINCQDLQNQALLGISGTYLLMGNPRKGIQYLTSKFQSLQEPLSSYTQWLRLFYIATYHLVLGQYDEGEKLLHQILQDQQNLNSYQLHRTYGNLGALYIRKGDHQKALQFSQKVYEYAVELGAAEEKISGLVNLAYVYLSLKEINKAEDYIEQATGLLKEIDDQRLHSLYWAGRAALSWQLRRHVQSFFQIIRSFYHSPPWKDDNSKIVLRLAIRKITTFIINRLTMPKEYE